LSLQNMEDLQLKAEQEAAAIASERMEVEEYLKQHSLENVMNEIVNFIVRERPEDPFTVLADELRATSEFSRQILGVRARELIGTDGNPVLEAEIETGKGIYKAQVASGPFDEDEERFEGKGMLKAVEAVHNVLAEKLVGKDPTLQTEIDSLLVEEKVRGNAVLAVSLACCRAGAAHADLGVADHLSAIANQQDTCLPLPQFTILNGGTHANTKFFIQEVSVIPIGAQSYEEALQMGIKVQSTFEKKVEENVNLSYTNYGALGGLAPVIETFDEVMMILMETIDSLEYSNVIKIGIDMGAKHYAVLPDAEPKADEEVADPDAGKGKKGKKGGKKDKKKDEPVEEEGIKYELSKWTKDAPIPVFKSSSDMVDMYVDWFLKYPLMTLGNPFHAEDRASFIKLRERIEEVIEEQKAQQAEEETAEAPPPEKPKKEDKKKGKKQQVEEVVEEEEPEEEGPPKPTIYVGGDENCFLQIYSEDLISAEEDIDRCEEARLVNTLLLTLRKGENVTGALALGTKAKTVGWGVVLSGDTSEFAEVEDDFLAEFAVGSKAGQFKAGGLKHAQYISKYNQLLRIETNGISSTYASPNFRRLP